MPDKEELDGPATSSGSILIVDDEKIIREGIAALIPWTEVGIRKVLQAANGAQALRIAMEAQPDIILTDICMPDMDGLTFIEKLKAQREDGYEPRIVVITGHDRFEYAQRSLKLGVQDLLLKPADEELLTDVIRTQMHLAMRSRRESETARRLARLVEGHSAREDSFRIGRMLWSIVGSGEPSAEDVEWMRSSRPGWLERPCRLGILWPEIPKGEDAALLLLSLQQFCRELAETAVVEGATAEATAVAAAARMPGTLLFFADAETGVPMFAQLENADATDAADAPLIDWADRSCSLIGREFSIPCRMGVSGSHSSISELRGAWLEAQAALTNGHALSAFVYRLEDRDRAARMLQRLYDQKRQQLTRIDEPVQMQMAVLDLADLLMRMTEEGGAETADRVRRECAELGLHCHWQLMKAHHQEMADAYREFLQNLADVPPADAVRRLTGFVHKISLLPHEEATAQNPIVKGVCDYIVAHLADELSVAELAARFYITPNYLSRIFRQTSGEGCNEFIVRKRMEKAKSLLSGTLMRAYLIADAVGYADKNYFSLAFRRYTGLSPTEYRARHGEVSRAT